MPPTGTTRAETSSACSTLCFKAHVLCQRQPRLELHVGILADDRTRRDDQRVRKAREAERHRREDLSACAEPDLRQRHRHLLLKDRFGRRLEARQLRPGGFPLGGDGRARCLRIGQRRVGVDLGHTGLELLGTANGVDVVQHQRPAQLWIQVGGASQAGLAELDRRGIEGPGEEVELVSPGEAAYLLQRVLQAHAAVGQQERERQGPQEQGDAPADTAAGDREGHGGILPAAAASANPGRTPRAIIRAPRHWPGYTPTGTFTLIA